MRENEPPLKVVEVRKLVSVSTRRSSQYAWIKPGAHAFVTSQRGKAEHLATIVKRKGWKVEIKYDCRQTSCEVSCDRCRNLDAITRQQRGRHAPSKYGFVSSEQEKTRFSKRARPANGKTSTRNTRKEQKKKRPTAKTWTGVSSRAKKKSSAGASSKKTWTDVSSNMPSIGGSDMSSIIGTFSDVSFSETDLDHNETISSSSSPSSRSRDKKANRKRKSIANDSVNNRQAPSCTPCSANATSSKRTSTPSISTNNNYAQSCATRSAKTLHPGSVAGRLRPRTYCPDAKNRFKRAELLQTFEFIGDWRQSDRRGYGIITRRHVPAGSTFVDDGAQYKPGKPTDAMMLDKRGTHIWINDEGYFDLSSSLNYSEWVNEARGRQLANMKFKEGYEEEVDGTQRPILCWFITRDLKEGEEVLTNYKPTSRTSVENKSRRSARRR